AEFGQQTLPDITLVPHHQSHAIATHALSGFDDSLVISYDGHGDLISTAIWFANRHSITKHKDFPPLYNAAGKDSMGSGSLGFLYSEPLATLGYGYGDDYKVMGLAPYGDPDHFSELFSKHIQLQAEGSFDIDLDGLGATIRKTIKPPTTPGIFDASHKHLAAAIQDIFETCAMHVLRHYQKLTGLRKLCIGGGCGQNTVFNGRLANEKLFEQVFIMPGCTDASLAIGAAFKPWRSPGAPKILSPAIAHCYWGPSIASTSELENQLRPWDVLLTIEYKKNIVDHAATHLSEGGTLGWMQGRMEFGPRALGNRSILADPRPAKNKDVVNSLIKNREPYRPFAVSICEDYLGDFLEDTEVITSKAFMTSTAQVRSDKRDLLGAVTHVNGSVRMQTVNAEQNPRYYALLEKFGSITGVPALLNTSFNSNGEPIVCTVEEGITCMLSSGLNVLAIGDFWIQKREGWRSSLALLKPSLPPTTQVSIGDMRETPIRDGALQHFISNGIDHLPLSRETAHVLCDATGLASLREIITALGLSSSEKSITDDLFNLWTKRLLILRP
ncbi:MAG: hypothetical protein JKY56_00350, partial [Kofleriaceae bacterium]|nr:hypothetical protein [Kofleriaceae bacterium]